MTSAEGSGEGSRVRAFLAGVLGSLAVTGLVASPLALWARSTVLDPSEVAAAVDRSLEEPAVRAAVAEELTDTVFEAVDVRRSVVLLLPGPLEGLADGVVPRVRDEVRTRLSDVLVTGPARDLLVTSVEAGHRQLIRVFERDGVTVGDDEVVVNTLPLVGLGLDQLQDMGIIDDDVVLPELDADGAPAAQIDELGEALGRDLPPTFGQLVVYRSDELGRLRGMVAGLERVLLRIMRGVAVLLGSTLVVLIAAVGLARRRPRALLVMLGATTAAFVVLRLMADPAVSMASKAFATTDDQATIRHVLDALTSGLVRLLTTLAVIGTVATATAWFLDRRRAGADART